LFHQRPRASLLLCAAVGLLLSSSPESALAAASPPAAQGPASWIGPGGNFPFNWDWSPQTTINATSMTALGLKWLFPLPAPLFRTPLGTSVIITPIIAGGYVYSITSSDTLMAESASNGVLAWAKNLSLDYDYPGLGVAPEAQNLMGHNHALWYTTEVKDQPLVWVAGTNYTVFAFNALSGAEVVRLDYLPVGVPGNFGFYDPGGKQLVIDQARGILTVTNSDSEGTDAGRGFFEGWNITASPPTLMWRTFLTPPQDGSDPMWSIDSVRNASYAWVFNGTAAVDLKSLPNSTLYGALYGDWGTFGYNGTYSFAGADGGWGGSDAFDPQTGIEYVGTSQPSPDWNATTRPGLDLWSSSVLAIDEVTGKLVWGFQTSPHDLNDWDCSWSVMLANATVGGQNQKVVMKGCKNGYFYALDAATGKMLWYFDAPSIKRAATSQILDPLSKAAMDRPWEDYPSTAPYLQNPCGSGGIESDPAYDPVDNVAVVATYNCPSYDQIAPTVGKGVGYGAFGKNLTYSGPSLPTNTTLWGIDVNTGKPLWSFDIANIGFRGGVDLTDGLVIVPAADGYLRALSEQTGKLVSQRYIGGPICTEPAIGQDSDGQEELVFPICSSHETHSPLPTNNGVMMAMAPTSFVSTTTLTSTVTASPSSPASPYLAFGLGLFVAVAAASVVFLARRGRR